jgi:hypothetical protein
VAHLKPCGGAPVCHGTPVAEHCFKASYSETLMSWGPLNMEPQHQYKARISNVACELVGKIKRRVYEIFLYYTMEKYCVVAAVVVWLTN